MKVICIDNDYYCKASPLYDIELKLKSDSVTLNKVYDVVSIDSDGHFIITDDNGITIGYYKERFKPVEEAREEKLKELLE